MSEADERLAQALRRARSRSIVKVPLTPKNRGLTIPIESLIKTPGATVIDRGFYVLVLAPLS